MNGEPLCQGELCQLRTSGWKQLDRNTMIAQALHGQKRLRLASSPPFFCVDMQNTHLITKQIKLIANSISIF